MAFADARSSAPVGSSRAIGPCARFSPCRPRGAARASTRVSSGRYGSARHVRPTDPSTGRAAEICSDEAPQLTDWPIEYLDNGAVKFRDNCTGEWAQTPVTSKRPCVRGDRFEDHRFFDASFPLGWSETPRVTMPP